MMVEQHPGTSEKHTDGMEGHGVAEAGNNVSLHATRVQECTLVRGNENMKLHWLPKPEHQHAAKGIMDASQGRAPSHIHARH